MTRYYSLEFLRGLAAIYVFASHYKEITGADAEMGEVLAFLRFGPEMVMLFFLLSGTVIRLAQQHRPRTPRAFLLQRAQRLWPLYWCALIFTLALEQRWGDPLTPSRVLGHLFMVQTQEGFITTVFAANDPLWSLSFEVFFYALFAMFIGPWQRFLMRGWCVMALLAMILQWFWNPSGFVGHAVIMFAYSSLWLVGYHLPDWVSWRQVSWSTALAWAALVPLMARLYPMDRWQYHCAAIHFGVGLCFVPLLLHALQGGNDARHWPNSSILLPYTLLVWLTWSFPTSSLGARVIYTALPLICWGSGILTQRWCARPLHSSPAVAQILGKNSYALYVLHAPCIYWANHLCPTLYTRVLFIVGVTPCVIFLGEYVFHPYLVRWLNRWTKSTVPRNYVG